MNETKPAYRQTAIKLLVFLIAFCAVWYVPIRNLKQNGLDAAFSYFAGDAFYYMNIACNSQKIGGFSFDSIHQTNGFHPLWQWILKYSFMFLENQEQQLFFVFFLCTLLTATGAGFVSLSLYRLTGKISLSLLSIIPGIFYYLFSISLREQGAVWSNINGMESSLSFFLFGILIYILFKNSSPDYTKLRISAISTILAAIVLTRLDDIFIFFPLFFLIYNYKTGKKRKNILILLFLPFFISLSSYIALNYINSGLFIPVSGLIKSGFNPLNIVYIINAFLANISINELFGLNLINKAILLFFPLLIALIYLIKGSNENPYLIFKYLSVYVILKSLYNLFFVSFWDQGSWYFTLNIILSNIFIALLIKDVGLKSKLKYSPLGISLFLIIFFSNVFIEIKRFPENNQYFRFWNQREKIRDSVMKKTDSSGILEMDDGIISWSLGLPAMSGFGLAIDKNGYNAICEGKLLDTAYSRGFNVLASLCYFKNPKDIPVQINNYTDFARNPFFAFKNQSPHNWNFRLLYADSSSGAVFIKLYK